MSHYPLIISIENHCNDEQQAKMAAIFQEELKDHQGYKMLATESIINAEGKTESEIRLPSPEDLQGKILLKASWKSVSVKTPLKYGHP